MEIAIRFYIAVEEFQEAIAQSKAGGYNVAVVEGEAPKAVFA